MIGSRRSGMLALAAVLMVAAACADGGSESSTATAAAPTAGDEAPSADCTPAASAEPGTTEATFDHNGVDRTYRITIPESENAAAGAPVVVNLHGFTSTAEQQDLISGLPETAGERGYVVVSPQGLDTPVPIGDGVVAPFWNIAPTVDVSQLDEADLEAADDIGFIHALLDQLETDLCLDAEREYLTGMSNGAAMATALICTDDERFAAAAPVAGAVFVSDCSAGDLTPILAIHGDADVLAPYGGGDVFGFPLDLPAAVDQLTELAALGGCEPEAELESIGEDVEHRSWPSCADDAEVELYTVLGGGHTWPGSELFEDGVPSEATDSGEGAEQIGDVESTFGFGLDEILGDPTDTIDATELILDFFDRHPASS